MSNDTEDLPRRLAREVRARGIDREDVEQEAHLAYLTVKGAWNTGYPPELGLECNLAVSNRKTFEQFATTYVRRMLKRLQAADKRTRRGGMLSDEQAIDNSPMPHEVAASSELWERLQHILTPRQSQVLHASIWEGASIPEIATALGITGNAVSIAKNEALQAIEASGITF